MAEVMVCLLQGSLSGGFFFFVSLSLLFLGQYPFGYYKGKKERRDLSPPTQTGDSTDNVGNWLWAEG